MDKTLRILVIVCTLAIIFAMPACTNDAQNKVDHLSWKWVSNSHRAGALLNQVYFYNSDGLLTATDIETKDSIVLCSEIGCEHTNEACPAKLSIMTKIFVWGEHIYCIDGNRYGMHLYRRNFAGDGLMRVCSLGTKYMEDQKNVEIEQCVLAGNVLYYKGHVEGQVLDEKSGTYTVQRVMDYIGRIDLKTGREDIIFEEEISNSLERITLCAAQEECVMIFHWNGTSVPVDEPSYSIESKKSPVELKYWHKAANTLTSIFQKKLEDCTEIKVIDNGKVYYKTMVNTETKDPGLTYSYDLNTGKETLVDHGAMLWYLGGGYALRKEERTQIWTVFNLHSGEELPNEIQELLLITNISDQGVVLERLLIEDDTNQVKERICCFITYESLADGLQEADLQYMYTF